MWPRFWKRGQSSGESRHVVQHVQRGEVSRCAWPRIQHGGGPPPVREHIVRLSLCLTKRRRQRGMDRLAMERMDRNASDHYVLGGRRIPTSQMQGIRKEG